MLHSLKDLMENRLHVADRKVQVDEAFLDPDERRLRYLAIDIGGWFNVDEVLVSADLLQAPRDGSTAWTLALDEAALEAAPRWHPQMGEETADLTGWPPIIVGPFGGTYAPMLLYEQMLARSNAGEEHTPEAGTVEGAVRRMDRATEWLGLAAFGSDGELGRVEDMLFDGASLKVERLILGSGGVFSHHSGAVPVSAIRHMASQGTHVVLDISSDDVIVADD